MILQISNHLSRMAQTKGFRNPKKDQNNQTQLEREVQIVTRSRLNLSTFRFRSILNVGSLGLMNQKARESLFSNVFSLQNRSVNAKGTIRRDRAIVSMISSTHFHLALKLEALSFFQIRKPLSSFQTEQDGTNDLKFVVLDASCFRFISTFPFINSAGG